MRRLLIVPAVLLLGSCASLDHRECLAGDWEGVGWRDGAYGAPANRIDQHAKACRKHHVRPDQAAWLRGREEGLLYYCTPVNAFRRAHDGAAYTGVCPPELEAAFLQAYSDGQVAAAARRELEDVSKRIQDEVAEAARLQEEIDAQDKLARDPKLTEAEHKSIQAAKGKLIEERFEALDRARGPGPRAERVQREYSEVMARFVEIYGPGIKEVGPPARGRSRPASSPDRGAE